MIRFTPKSEEQINAARLLKPGFGDYEITKAEEVTTQNGESMIKLTLKVLDEQKKEGVIFDYISIKDENFHWKLRHFMYSCGLGQEYENGFIDIKSLIKKRGKLKIGIKKDKKGIYLDSNNVLDYIVNKVVGTSQTINPTEINPPPMDVTNSY